MQSRKCWTKFRFINTLSIYEAISITLRLTKRKRGSDKANSSKDLLHEELIKNLISDGSDGKGSKRCVFTSLRI